MADNFVTSGKTDYGSGDAGAALANAKGATQTLGQLVTAVQRQAFTVGTISGVNTIGTSLIQVLANPNPVILWVVFHNPSDTISLLLSPTSVGATFASRGGGFLVLPGDFLALTGAVSVAWSGIASSGTNNPLTIITNPQ